MPESSLLYKNERALLKQYMLIAGVDEAGRGPISGPVVIAAVILNHKHPIIGVNDSKQLSLSKREKLYSEIKDNALSYAIIEISHQRIDEINILQAVLEGMHLAVNALTIKPDLCLIDGNRLPVGISIEARACIKGDSTFASIAAASILAKVHRDKLMTELDNAYPGYGFAQHKGYPTVYHLNALAKLGPCPVHRLTYAPVRQLEIYVNSRNK